MRKIALRRTGGRSAIHSSYLSPLGRTPTFVFCWWHARWFWQEHIRQMWVVRAVRARAHHRAPVRNQPTPFFNVTLKSRAIIYLDEYSVSLNCYICFVFGIFNKFYSYLANILNFFSTDACTVAKKKWCFISRRSLRAHLLKIWALHVVFNEFHFKKFTDKVEIWLL